jgi:hypothetical protein
MRCKTSLLVFALAGLTAARSMSVGLKETARLDSELSRTHRLVEPLVRRERPT